MAVITSLVLILLATAGARKIPLHEDAPTELPLELYNLLSDTKTFADPIFPTGELVGRMVDEEDRGLQLNKNADGDETVEDYVYNGVSLENDVKEKMVTQESSDYKEDKTNSMLTPVDTIEVQNKENIEKGFLEYRSSLKGELLCPEGEIKIGNRCQREDLDNTQES